MCKVTLTDCRDYDLVGELDEDTPAIIGAKKTKRLTVMS